MKPAQLDLFEEDDSDDGITIDLSDIVLDSETDIEIHPWVAGAGATMIDTITLGSGTGIYSNANANGYSWQFDDFTTTTQSSNKLKLEGDDADIEINGRSVMAILDSIEQRLGLLKCREDLESEWEELKSLGDRYRTKLAEIETKQQMWEALKKMPPPQID